MLIPNSKHVDKFYFNRRTIDIPSPAYDNPFIPRYQEDQWQQSGQHTPSGLVTFAQATA
jgi:hypothetical protein